MSAAYGQVAIQGGDGEEGAVDAQKGKYSAALYPLFSACQQDELLGYHAQAQQGGEGDECNEAQHLAEYLHIAPRVVRHLCQGGLCHGRNHTVYGAGGHVVPLACRAVDTCLAVAEVFAQEHAEGMIVEDIEDIGN